VRSGPIFALQVVWLTSHCRTMKRRPSYQTKSKVEKFIPHFELKLVKELARSGKFKITRSARQSARMLGFTADSVLAVVQGLARKDFYKSMTTHGNHRVWQDVYRPMTPVGKVYLKLMVIDDLLIVSFKEL
jgi:motility quorum-sensing regulator/GCU-specific mRNA interferase toxin